MDADVTDEMLDRITGDNPPPLESWSDQAWIHLQWEHEHRRREIARLRAELAEVARAICEQAADVLWISDTETVVDRIYSTLGVEDADHLDREFPARAECREDRRGEAGEGQ